MKRWWQVMLDCGHVSDYEQPFGKDILLCTKCVPPASRDVVAIETREWYVKCITCRFARWVGASEQDAKLIQRKHWVAKSHLMNRHYLVHPDIREIWRSIYGRKRTPRRFINPGERIQAKASVYSKIAQSKDGESDTDTPPF